MFSNTDMEKQQATVVVDSDILVEADKINVRAASAGDFHIESVSNMDEYSPETPAHQVMYAQSVMRIQSVPKRSEDDVRLTPGHEDFYPRLAIASLIKMLKDETLSVHHSSVTQAIMNIFKSLGLRSVPFLDQMIPYLLQIVKRCGPGELVLIKIIFSLIIYAIFIFILFFLFISCYSHIVGLRESLIQQLSQLAAIVRTHLAPYIGPIFEVVTPFWDEHQSQILSLIEEMALASGEDFRPFIHRLLKLLLSSLVAPKLDSGMKSMTKNMSNDLKDNKTRQSSNLPASSQGQLMNFHSLAFRPLERSLSCVDAMRYLLRPYLNLIIPALCKLLEKLQVFILLFVLRSLHYFICTSWHLLYYSDLNCCILFRHAIRKSDLILFCGKRPLCARCID